MAGEFEERQEIPAPQPEPRAVVVETPSPVIMTAAPAATATAEAGEDQYFSPADALRKNPQFQSRSYGMDDEGPQFKNEARNDNDLSGHGEPKKLRADEIALGGSQNNGAQMIRANLMTARNDTKTDSIQAQLDRARLETLRLAQWNSTQVNFGGVQMTQLQALQSLRKITENPDKYADQAVKEGRIKKGEEEEYKKTATRMKELMEKDQAGKLSAEERREKTLYEQSTMGRAVAEDMGSIAKRNQALERAGTSFSAPESSALKTAPAINDAFTSAVYNRQIIAQADVKPTAPTVTNVEQVQKNNAMIPGIS